MTLQNVLIIGAGTGGFILLNLLTASDAMHVKAIVDKNSHAPGIERAKDLNIANGEDWEDYITDDLHIIFDVTGDESLFKEIVAKRPPHAVVIPGTVANLLVQLLQENTTYIKRLQGEMHKRRLVFDSIDEGMIGIDAEGFINFYNKSASKMTGIDSEEAIGLPIEQVIPTSGLPSVLRSGQVEMNKELILDNGVEIVSSRYPLFDEKGSKAGAFAIFKDISEVVSLAEEITDLKQVKTLLEAIIYSSEDAISVVDENGTGILVNPAYTRITGLSEGEIIGKPAAVDIIEGESIHMKVLQSKQPVRGVKMKVGEKKRDVIVNVAPIIVDDKIKGSVGVIHDITEMEYLLKELHDAKNMIRTLEPAYSFQDIYGESADLEISIEQAKLAARSFAPVLLRAEAGTGKELFAHAIHSEGDRKHQPFIRINCAGIEPDLLETELLLVNSGEPRGTLYLDEITELPMPLQNRLLQYIQTEPDERRNAIRVIAATAKNLEKQMLEGLFSEDLYYALHRIAIHIPPLRQRKKDVPVIVEKMLIQLNNEFGMNIERVSDDAMAHLVQYDWPGNVRELENVLSRAMIYMKTNETVLRLSDIMKSFTTTAVQEADVLSTDGTLASLMDDYEKNVLASALDENKGNKSLTATRLGISLRSLYYKLEKYNLV